MRVFVLGAGASLDAGYPLAREMGNCLAAWINTLPSENERHRCPEQIVDVYGGLDDFEAILADLMTCSPGSRAATLGTDRPYLLSNLQEAIRDYFNEIRSKPAPRYDELARILRRGDVVITFNYDLGVERALRGAELWDIKTGYGFSIDGQETSPVEVLKLHGSTNWRALLFGGRTGFFVGNAESLGNRPVLFFRPDIEYLGYRDFADPLCARLDRAASLPVMILPALPKQFGYDNAWKAFWDDLWNRAESAIDKARELTAFHPQMGARDRCFSTPRTKPSACRSVAAARRRVLNSSFVITDSATSCPLPRPSKIVWRDIQRRSKRSPVWKHSSGNEECFTFGLLAKLRPVRSGSHS